MKNSSYLTMITVCFFSICLLSQIADAEVCYKTGDGVNLAKSGIDLGAILKGCGQSREKCNREVDKFDEQIEANEALLIRCQNLRKLMHNEEERRAKLSQLGCESVEALVRQRDQFSNKCNQLNDAVGQLHYSTYRTVKISRTSKSSLPKSNSAREYFETFGCSSRWHKSAENSGLTWSMLRGFLENNIRQLDKSSNSTEIRAAAQNALERDDADGFCEKYFPVPEI